MTVKAVDLRFFWAFFARFSSWCDWR